MITDPIQFFPDLEPYLRRSTASGWKGPVPGSTHQTGNLLCVAGLDGYFKHLNAGWAVQLGWSVQELLAVQFVEFVHPEDRAATCAELSKLIAGADSIAFENRYARRDGSYHWLQWNAQPIPGHPLVQAIARDVTEQRRLEKEIVEISDQEKDRLGRDLHDGLCQNLAGIAALSTTLSRQLAEFTPSGSAMSAEITHLLNETIAQARDMARGLNPLELDGSGLICALRMLTKNFQEMVHVSCTFRCNRVSVRLSPETETHLYRIVQEALRNAVSHGRADKIAVTLRIFKDQCILAIRDNGSGVSVDAVQGNGMRTMQYRARLIGASLWMRPNPRRGTWVNCVFGPPSSSKEANRHD